MLHSAVHQYVDAAFPRRIRKTWISEGLAHYLCLNVSEHYRDWASAQHSLKIPRYTPLSSLVHEEGLGRFGNSTQASVRLLQLALLFRFLLEELPDTARDELEPDKGSLEAVAPSTGMMRASRVPRSRQRLRP